MFKVSIFRQTDFLQAVNFFYQCHIFRKFFKALENKYVYQVMSGLNFYTFIL